MRSWAEVPTDQVVRIVGTTVNALHTRMADHPEGAPATVTFRADRPLAFASAIAELLDALEATAIAAYPAWLPDAWGISGVGGSSISAVRSMARRAAAGGAHYGPFLADLAVAAMTDTAVPRARFEPEIRASGLRRVISEATGRAGLVVIVEVGDGLAAESQRSLVAAAEWLVDHASAGVWLFGRPLLSDDRVVTIHWDEPVDEPQPVPRPTVIGRPHPHSASEQMLEGVLSRCDWAFGRAWNHLYKSGPLANSIRLDLVWVDEKCVVEIDGDEHREAGKYAADRRRDVELQLDGFAVLRFTNHQLRDDVGSVVGLIERFVRARRLGAQEGQRDVG